jgi:hypothetical protein
MTYSILLVFEKSDLSNVENQQAWESCITNLSILAKQNIDIQLLGENVLLIPLDKGLDGLSKLIPEVCKIGYRYLILNEEVTWHKVAKKV